MIIFDYLTLGRIEEKILFYNLSGKCELRIKKKNIKNKTYDECVSYVRTKLYDISITAIKNFNAEILFNGMEYNIIIRNNHREMILDDCIHDIYTEYNIDLDNLLCILDNKILLDDKEIVLAILGSRYYNKQDTSYHIYKTFSKRLKYDHDICRKLVKIGLDNFTRLNYKIKNDIDFVLSLGKAIINSIYRDLPDNIKNNLTICTILVNYSPHMYIGLSDEIKNNIRFISLLKKKTIIKIYRFLPENISNHTYIIKIMCEEWRQVSRYNNNIW